MKQQSEIFRTFLNLRLVIAFLGQANQAGWWDCNFLDATGLRFLETTFPRTAYSAALRATTEAACVVHDRAMGRVGNYHLFRMPTALEDQLEATVEHLNWAEGPRLIGTRETATATLKTIADCFVKAPQGPVQVGIARKIFTPTSVKEVAAHYLSAFQDGIRCYPYFAAE